MLKSTRKLLETKEPEHCIVVPDDTESKAAIVDSSTWRVKKYIAQSTVFRWKKLGKLAECSTHTMEIYRLKQ